jgi:hypothetical protein
MSTEPGGAAAHTMPKTDPSTRATRPTASGDGSPHSNVPSAATGSWCSSTSTEVPPVAAATIPPRGHTRARQRDQPVGRSRERQAVERRLERDQLGMQRLTDPMRGDDRERHRQRRNRAP